MVKVFQLLYFLSTYYNTIVYCNYPQITIEYGTLRGQYLYSASGRLFSSFTSVPYSKPPVGQLRFQEPHPAEPWHGILDATKDHPLCPQITANRTELGSEDCLYLNVYTPQLSLPCNALLPVMIYFFGGRFASGDANYKTFGPDILLDKNIVLVVPNYRLGPLGFLSTGDEVVVGNNGLKDQNLAIKWVKENIIYFGGNPNTVTLFGQSAGGASAHLHMLSPLSKDLIHGVISESGTALSNWAIAVGNEGPTRSKQLAQYFGCPTKESCGMIECLRKIDAYELIKAQDIFYEWDNMHPLIPFKPVIEPDIKGAFLSKHPVETIKSGKAANIPFLTGFNSEDGAILSSLIYGRPPNPLNEINSNFKEIAPIALLYRDTSPNAAYVTKEIRKFYFNDGEINNFTRTELTNLFTDRLFLDSTNEVVLLHLKYTNQPVYYYIFSYRGSTSFTTQTDPGYDYGVDHGDELLYLFALRNDFQNYRPAEEDNAVAKVMSTLWTSFAATGNPTPIEGLYSLEKWHPVQSENLEYYMITTSKNTVMTEKPFWERAKFWMYLPTSIRKLLKRYWYLF